VDAGHVFKDAFDFIFRQNGGDSYCALRAKLGEAGFVHANVKDVAIEEKDGAEGLVLGGGGDFFDGGEVGEELVDLGRAHFFRVALIVEEDVFCHPNDVGVAGAGGVVPQGDATRCLRLMTSRYCSRSFFSFGGLDEFGSVILLPFWVVVTL